MSNNPKIWNTGETSIAVKLAQLENGSGGVMIVHANNILDDQNKITGKVLDKTWLEIWNAFAAGIPVFLNEIDGTYESDPHDDFEARMIFIDNVANYEGHYCVYINGIGFETMNQNDYPSSQRDEE